MSEFVIHAIERRETIRLVTRPDHYTLTPEKGWVWLQKACIWVLKKIGAVSIEKLVDVKVIRFNPEDFVKALFQQRQMIERLEYGPVSKVYIGAKDFEQLMGAKDVQIRFGFGAEYSHNRTLMGLRCEVIPWMEGILIV